MRYTPLVFLLEFVGDFDYNFQVQPRTRCNKIGSKLSDSSVIQEESLYFTHKNKDSSRMT
ncbi:hypothetical protein A2V82_17480 [candidate division KSB1 bacterium RBG_16_48_16]|nr:MAG: hypothetical protein A2V82_17480 [candidate division KSB1 bacterium RBG_16_48_16]